MNENFITGNLLYLPLKYLGQGWSGSKNTRQRGSNRRGNGEEVCEGHGYSQGECESIGCCQWEESECWSAVGRGLCRN